LSFKINKNAILSLKNRTFDRKKPKNRNGTGID